jgi:hypothetical protein
MDEADCWVEPKRAPTDQELRAVLGAVVGQAVKEIMGNHVYTSCGLIYKQTEGGSIGLRATGEISRLVCLKFDQLLRDRLASVEIRQLMYGRYVDDSNSAYLATDLGARYEQGELIVRQEFIEADTSVPPDKRTFMIVQEVTNLIWENIQWTYDVPSNHDGLKMPVLDLKVGMTGRRVELKFYEKAVSTRYTILARSTHSWHPDTRRCQEDVEYWTQCVK